MKLAYKLWCIGVVAFQAWSVWYFAEYRSAALALALAFFMLMLELAIVADKLMKLVPSASDGEVR